MNTIAEQFQDFMEYSLSIDRKIERLEELQRTAGDAPISDFESIRGGGGVASDRTGRTAAVLEDMQDEIKRMTQRETEERKRLDDLLYTKVSGRWLLSPDERVVIQMFYFDRLRIGRIADVLCLSDRGCRNLKQRGLEKLESISDCIEA